MSAIETNRSFALGGIGNSFALLSTLIGSWKDQRTTRRELNRLSDRELEDIGLCRADIDQVARGR